MGVVTHTNLGMNQTVCKHNQLLEITQGAISDLFNTYRYRNKHWPYSLLLHQPTLTKNTKNVKLIQHHQYKYMYHKSRMFRATELQQTTDFLSIVFSTTRFLAIIWQVTDKCTKGNELTVISITSTECYIKGNVIPLQARCGPEGG